MLYGKCYNSSQNRKRDSMNKIKRVLRRGLRLPVKLFRGLDRSIQRGFTKFFRRLYKIKALRPLTKKIYPFFYYHHRIAAAGLCALFVLGIVTPALQPYLRSHRYRLNDETKTLLGEADEDLTKKLTFDSQAQLFQFNKDAKKEPVTDSNPVESLKSQVGGASEEDEQLYSVDVPKDLSRGVTYYDNQMQLSFKIVPQFSTMPGEQQEGHLIYPLRGINGKLAYTVGAGGMKENVVLYESPGNEFHMEYKLELPKSLEARLIPETGEVGIYAADPVFFGNISYGSSDDVQKIQLVREKSEKTYLTFKIPAPVVLGLGKIDQRSVASVESYFELSGDTLRVVAKGLDKAEYPLSIDPSVTVDSNSDFQTGNIEDNNLSISSGELHRGQLTGGSLGAFNSGTNLPATVGYHDAIAYNGYLYVLGGWDNEWPTDFMDTVRYAAINSNGSIGAWNTTTPLPYPNADLKALVYNGYMYITGGGNNDAMAVDDVFYAPINTDGTLGAWKETTSFTTARYDHAAAVYNGYMYIAGGDAGNGFLDDVQYAPINADGSLGTWQYTTALEGELAGHSFNAYNGYMYRVGGDWTSTTSYAPINADGTLGVWVYTSSLPSVRYSHAAAVYNGYIYITGGSSAGYFNTTFYAQINANGTLGAWESTTNLSTNRSHLSAVAYNGYFYVIGGESGSGGLNQVVYAAMNPPGVVGNFNTTSSFSTGRRDFALVAYNGYLYILGGAKATTSTACSGSSSSYCNDVQYAPINANGTLGAWSTTSSFFMPRAWLAAVAYNGYMYISGGERPYVNDVQYAPINANGTLGSWSYTTSLPANNSGHAMVAYNGYMYTTGGYTNGSINTVAYAPINANGTLGSWNYTTSFTTARYDHTSVAYNGYMYVIGGTSDSAGVQYAPINANGTLGSWSYTTSLPAGRSNHSTVVYNGYIYVLGGSSSNTVYYAPINANGTIGTWQTTTTFTTARYGHASVVYNGYVYVVGGQSVSSYLNDVQYARINNGGSGVVGAWSTTSNFTTARLGHASVVYNGYIYILGGEKSSVSTACRNSGSDYLCNDVQYAPINANGTIGTWQTTSYFSIPRTGSTAVAYNGYMYIIGGFINYDTYARTNNVQYAPINADGSLGAWQNTSLLPDTIFAHASAIYNGYVYVMGGNWQLNTVYYAQFNSNGTLGTWQSTTSFNIARNGLKAVAYNGYMYLAGGYSQSPGDTYHAQVEYAPINSNGTLGTWKYTTNLPVTLTDAALVAHNGYLYISGGYMGLGNPSTRVYFAHINASGAIGDWQLSTNLTVGRQGHTAIAHNGYMYVLGGYGNSGDLNTVHYAPLQAIPRKALYSKVIDLGVNSRVTNISYTGTLPGGARNIRYRMAGIDKTFGATHSAAGPLACEDSIGQYIQLFVTLDDSGMGVFPDNASSNNAKVGSITVDSSPVSVPPEKRLRHGAWFNNGQLQPFDTGGGALCS